MPVKIKNYKPALVGLSILLAFCLAVAWGKKPKLEKVGSTLQVLSAEEIRAVLAQLPTQYLIPPIIKNVLQDMGKDNDRKMVIGLLRLSEIKGISLLNNLYSNARFYKGLYAGTLSKEPFVYLMVVTDDDCYYMPQEFNRLLDKKGLKLNDRNIISLAKAFVIMALGNEAVTGLEGVLEKELLSFPQITFLEGKRVKEVINRIAYMVKLKVKINEQIEDWFFNVSYGQFVVISRGDPKEPIKKYGLPIYGGVKLGPWWRK
ncbi:MAG: hypothetical protein OEZ20_07595 [candidate division WOR-3 bacterium]|nr:hypothetical protein [candidate division WOR-3 bacterium]MDH5684310.1 hypothetical protein [candidate division WOR-3 bacterium]